MIELLKRLKLWLPKENNLPDKYPGMKQMLKDLRMQVKHMHAKMITYYFGKTMLMQKNVLNVIQQGIQLKKNSISKGQIKEGTKKSFKILSYNFKIN